MIRNHLLDMFNPQSLWSNLPLRENLQILAFYEFRQKKHIKPVIDQICLSEIAVEYGQIEVKAKYAGQTVYFVSPLAYYRTEIAYHNKQMLEAIAKGE